jgi:two-component system, LytTR family, sensor kinase
MKRIILLLLVLSCFRFSYGQVLSPEIESLARKQVESIFLDGDEPVRYYSNILIRLDGNPTKEDSLIFKELVDTLNLLIAKWDVYLIPNGTSNLEVEINKQNFGNWKNVYHQDTNPTEIVTNTVYLDLPSEIDFITRKKIIYYNILRSLVCFNRNPKKAELIKGSVFSEMKAENITFHPVDFEIIKELYSQKYERKPGTIRISGNGYKNLIYSVFSSVVALLLSLSFLIFMSLRGKFSKHDYVFLSFWRQGVLVVLAFSLSSFLSYMFRDYLFLNSFKTIVNEVLITAIQLFYGIVVVILVYFIERRILGKTQNFTIEIFVPFFSVAIVSTALGVLFLLLVPIAKPAVVYSSTVSNIILCCFIIGFVRSIYIYMSKKSENIIREKDLQLAKISELHKQAELQSLRAKINPHFLYNALNSIASLATTDAHKTEQMALALSDFFKYAINREQKQLNTLSEELNAVRTYLEIEKVRFGDRLSFEIDCPEELLNIQIPQLLIQPLVENAIKHGLSQITENGLIRIVVANEKDQLKIRIYDNGPAFPDGPLSGFGIQNTQERITLLYGAKAAINWQNGPEKYIEISLPLEQPNISK